MSENKSKDHNSQSDNDEDFGLPPVNISPLQSSSSASAGQSSPVAEVSAPEPVREKDSSPEPEKKKDRTNWVILFILLFILLVGYGVYHFGWMDNFKQETVGTTAEDEPDPVLETPDPEPVPEPVPTVPEAAEDAPAPSLTEIDGRAESSRYFLVVGSFIDDDLARDYSNRLNNSGKNTFLVHPYGDIHFYRLAVGQFENLDLALEAMNTAQNDYEENLWVLKY
ncbi:hypothetical protein SAMN04488057_104108 [Cyclobacterium lianum]|uniref:SPOR domain-containing protein n=1 Tax=Cyclobacterium lianum TaxID=388280 RepID=A0A1M7M6P9_9BACT|nr:SPOR domain-containing protein [Cyclobacterium lianum]SHM85915.1 hypothetical protein SAMN04488057_104108 [Cyclobacterium lianum]